MEKDDEIYLQYLNKWEGEKLNIWWNAFKSRHTTYEISWYHTKCYKYINNTTWPCYNADHYNAKSTITWSDLAPQFAGSTGHYINFYLALDFCKLFDKLTGIYICIAYKTNLILLKFDNLLWPMQIVHNMPLSISTRPGNSICQDRINDRTHLELSYTFLFCSVCLHSCLMALYYCWL